MIQLNLVVKYPLTNVFKFGHKTSLNYYDMVELDYEAYPNNNVVEFGLKYLLTTM